MPELPFSSHMLCRFLFLLLGRLILGLSEMQRPGTPKGEGGQVFRHLWALPNVEEAGGDFDVALRGEA